MDEIKAFAFGFVLAATVGPIAFLIIDASLTRGLKAGLACGMGAATADLIYSLAALAAGASIVRALDAHAALFRIASSLLLIGLAVWMAMSSRSAADGKAGDGVRIGYAGMLALTLASPLTIVFFVGLSGQMQLSGGWGEIIYFALWIFLASVLAQAGFALCGALLRRWIGNPQVLRRLHLASAAVIGAFGLAGLLTLTHAAV